MDVWREVFYYEYIRDVIIKQYKCPNFILLYSYYIAKNVKIDFNKIEIKSIINDYPDDIKNEKLLKNIETDFNELLDRLTTIKLDNINNENNIKNKEDLLKYSDQCLILLTESPNYNIFDWATRTYRINSGIVKHMEKNGFHTDMEWEVVIF